MTGASQTIVPAPPVIRFLRLCLCALVLLLGAKADGAPAKPGGINDLVGIARINPCTFALATRASLFHQWRIKTLAFEEPVKRLELSLSGTKVLVEFETRIQFVDLTDAQFAPLTSGLPSKRDNPCGRSSPSKLPAARHTLGTGEPFGLMGTDGLQIFDDTRTGANSEAYAAPLPLGRGVVGVINHNWMILRLHADGRLSTGEVTVKDGAASITSEETKSLRVTFPKLNRSQDPDIGDFQVVAGTRHARYPFIVVNHDVGEWVVSDADERTRRFIYPNPNIAMLAAGILAAMRSSDPAGGESTDSDRVMPELTVEKLSEHIKTLEMRSGNRSLPWRFVPVVPDVRLYAPILQLAADETVLPSGVEVWDTVRLEGRPPIYDKWPDWRPLYNLYRALRDELPCIIYHKDSGVDGVSSHEGSWVIEYWFYYPFDLNGLDQHLHDTEHLFVEVDKLGGVVRRVIGAAHGRTTSNNIYLADDSAAPVPLPLRAIVERGKHASAPDINQDGLFTPGIDENGAGERSHVWGVRDVTGATDDALHSYESGMMLRRSLRNALVVDVTKAVWSDSYVKTFVDDRDAEVKPRRTCQLERFPSSQLAAPPDPKRTATKAAAVAMLVDNEDSKRPEEILKPWSFPPGIIRLGLSHGLGERLSWSFDEVLMLREVIRLATLRRKDFALPGRLAFGATFDQVAPSSIHGYYERFTTNLFGFYAGFHAGPDHGVWYAAGPMFEFPDFWPVRTNVNLHFGVAFADGSAPRLDFQLQIGIYQVPKQRFGIGRQ